MNNLDHIPDLSPIKPDSSKQFNNNQICIQNELEKSNTKNNIDANKNNQPNNIGLTNNWVGLSSYSPSKEDLKLLQKKLKNDENYTKFNYNFCHNAKIKLFSGCFKKDTDQKLFYKYLSEKSDINNYMKLIERFEVFLKFSLSKEDNFLLSNLRKKTLEELRLNDINKSDMEIIELKSMYEYYRSKINQNNLSCKEKELIEASHNAIRVLLKKTN